MIDGLKPYPAMKDSGVPWLGQVPEHWEVRRLRNVADLRVSNVDKKIADGELPVRLCNYVDVYKNERITQRINFMRASASREEIDRFMLKVGDVVITKDSEEWTDIGVPAIVEYEAPDLICGYHLAVLRPRNGVVLGEYLFRAMQCQPVAYQFQVSANGVTRYGLSHGAIKDVFIPVPPPNEQGSIIRVLAYVENLIRRFTGPGAFTGKQAANVYKRGGLAGRAIELLREYRTRLIADVVTGKLDVRAAAAALPEPEEAPDDVEAEAELPAEEDGEALGEVEDDEAAA